MPYKAKLHVDLQAEPRFYKPRPVPFAIRAAIGKELDLLEKQGVIEKVAILHTISAGHEEWHLRCTR